MQSTQTLVPLRHRFANLVPLDSADHAALDDLITSTRSFVRGAALRHEGDPADAIFWLHDGWVASSATRDDGGRFIMKFHLPGDLLGAPSMVSATAVETLRALTPVVASRIPLALLGSLFASFPRLSALLFVLAQQERLMLSDRLLSVGRSNADSSIAALLIQLFDGLCLINPDTSLVIEFPITQEEIADALGLSPVHVNRVLRDLTRRELIKPGRRRMTLIDLAGLRRLAGVSRRRKAATLDWLPTGGSREGDR